jgi:hypothetical protein
MRPRYAIMISRLEDVYKMHALTDFLPRFDLLSSSQT